MSFLNSTTTLHHVSPIPAHISFETAVAALHDNIHLIKADPEYKEHEEVPPKSTVPNTRRFKVTDNMALPKGLGLPQTITYEEEITNVEDGLDFNITAPLGVRQEIRWRIVKRSEVNVKPEQINDKVEDGGEWALDEITKITANRLLSGTAVSKCEASWKGIQGSFIDLMLEMHAEKETK